MKTIWATANQNLQLGLGEIHIWQRCLQASEQICDEAFALLSEDEQAKAQRFHFAKHRRRYIMARSGLRKILCYYFPLQAEQFIFAYSPHGKPSIAYPKNPNAIQFNISHSGEIALYGLSCQYELGIDIETISDRPTDGLAQRFFAPEEAAQLMRLHQGERKKSFYDVWTQKEAFIKALGLGLSYPLTNFEVKATGTAGLIKVIDDDFSQWHLQKIEVLEGYSAHFAIRQPVRRTQYWLLPQ